MGFDANKLQKFLKKGGKANIQTGGKGSVRRKRKIVRKSGGQDVKKLKNTLNKLNVRDIPAIEEVNLFMKDSEVIHFKNPKVQASIAANTYVVSGTAQKKKLQDLLPGIMTQLGPDNLEDLKNIYASCAATEADKTADDSDDDVPDLVGNFEEVSKETTDEPAVEADEPVVEAAEPAAEAEAVEEVAAEAVEEVAAEVVEEEVAAEPAAEAAEEPAAEAAEEPAAEAAEEPAAEAAAADAATE